MSYEARIVCDEPGCDNSVFHTGATREIAQTNVQAYAVERGWFVARDRLFVNRDKCPAHAPRKVNP